MNEGQRNHSSRKSSRRESVVPKTPDVLKHQPYKNYERSLSPKAQRKTGRDRRNFDTLSSKLLDDKWYSSGYPALRAADKKIREVKARQETQKVREQVKPKRKSRSYSRGHSVYFNDDDPTTPYYRSKSVESFRRKSATYGPVVNEKDVISLTYTGRLSRENTGDSQLGSINGKNRCSVSRRRGSGIVQKKVESVVPHLRRNYDFDDLRTRIYQQIQKIYGEPDSDIKNKQFFTTLAQIQSEHVRMKHLKMSKSDRIFLEKMFEEMTNMKKETGKILRNSTTRYSTQFEYPSPVNDKVRRLPRGRQHENFLTKMPKTRERLKLKPIRHGGHTRDHRYNKRYEHYENFNQRIFDKQIGQFQKVKEPENPSDMLKFLQQAERLLTEYSQGLLYHSEKGYGTTFDQFRDHPSPSRHRKLKPLLYSQTKSSEQKLKDVYGRTSPQKQANTLNVPSKTKAPVYTRSKTFYDGRKHLQFHSRASRVDHQLHEAKHAGGGNSYRHEFSLRGLAT